MPNRRRRPTARLIGEFYRSGRWYTKDGKSVQYEWSADDGAAAMQHAVDFIKEVGWPRQREDQGFSDAGPGGYLLGGAAALFARRWRPSWKVPLALHVLQSVPEFQEMVRRNGCSPVEWLEKIGFLGSDVILGHVIMPGGSSWTNYHADDVGILADTSTNVAHAVWVFASPRHRDGRATQIPGARCQHDAKRRILARKA